MTVIERECRDAWRSAEYQYRTPIIGRTFFAWFYSALLSWFLAGVTFNATDISQGLVAVFAMAGAASATFFLTLHLIEVGRFLKSLEQRGIGH